MRLRAVRYDDPDATRLIAAVQAVYLERYGGADDTPLDPSQFAPPSGLFTIGYFGREAVACGGWRARDAEPDDPALRDGDAEIKRMFVLAEHRGRGFARVVLAELEHTASAAGRHRMVLETGDRQPEAVTLYLSSGYRPIDRFGTYRHEHGCRCFGKTLDGHDSFKS